VKLVGWKRGESAFGEVSHNAKHTLHATPSTASLGVTVEGTSPQISRFRSLWEMCVLWSCYIRRLGS